MKFTLSWLKTHLDTGADLATITRTLTMLGLEVEAVVDQAAQFAPFVVGDVVECQPHPNADRLRVCVVDTGKARLQVVCGAPNARQGMKGVFAAAGTTIPRTGLLLKKTTIRGVESNGMLCSAYEMGLSDDHEGIIELPADAPVGRPFAAVLGLDDPMLDVNVLPNRADCLGVRGIARDLAAAGLGTLTPRPIAAVPGAFASPIAIRFDLGDHPEACPLFVGRYVRGVRNGPSPEWLQRRLTAIGLRPISALVDITNFLTFDANRPLHVFDAAKLAGDLVVSLARGGERLAALNGREYAIEPGMCVIGDTAGVQSLGGVIGGAPTGVDEGTTEVLVEAALFDPLRTATTGRKLGIASDARFRFERGIDPAAVFDGMEAATRLILELCGGSASTLAVAGAAPDTRRTIRFAPARVASLGGVAVDEDDSRRILGALGFAVGAMDADGSLPVVPPSWRADIEGSADLVEEVLRVHGFDHIPATPFARPGNLPALAVTRGQRRVAQLRRLLAERGLTEAVTWSFMPAADAARFGGGDPALALANPISVELAQMRPTPLPNLLDAARRNADRGFGDLALYEVGPGYRDPTPDGQSTIAAGLRAGAAAPRHWSLASRPVDAFDVKADVLAALAGMGVATDPLQLTRDAPDWYHPGRSACLRLGNKVVLGQFGEIHPAVAQRYDLTGPVVGFEIFVDAVPLPRQRAGRHRPLLKPSQFQAVSRDFAFVVARDVAADAIARAARDADKALVADVAVFDLYEGKGLPEGAKSIAIAVTLQPTERTLTDADLEAVSAKIVGAVERVTGGKLRG
ncbi:MAG TPA: phenylalanine--tRNA ligase subunit beta [Candidatus Sulfotelmatobacter sp.]|nr:phenylalanine--tRNA ligase subunit beta [Candidatus Sulfotelmatobacter sp.]